MDTNNQSHIAVREITDHLQHRVVVGVANIMLVFTKEENSGFTELEVGILMPDKEDGSSLRGTLTLSLDDDLTKIATWVSLVTATRKGDVITGVNPEDVERVIMITLDQIKATNADPDAEPVDDRIAVVRTIRPEGEDDSSTSNIFTTTTVQ